MSVTTTFDSKTWAEANFQGCQLGDERRSRRLVKFAQQAADQPAASLPKIGEDWNGVRGIYRLLDDPHVTLESVTQTHRELIRKQSGRRLVISDTTHVDFGWQRSLPDAGPVGPGGSQGFLLHSALLIDPMEDSLVGVAGQVSHIRSRKPKRKRKNNSKAQQEEWRESRIWEDLFQQVGPPPPDSQYIHVCDAGADIFEVYCSALELSCDCLIRVGRRHRGLLFKGKKAPVSQVISQASADGQLELGRYELAIPRGNGRQARTAVMKVSAAKVVMPLPAHRSPRVREYVAGGGQPIELYLVVAMEVDPPRNAEPLEWSLLTTLPATSFAKAWEIIGFYEKRWIIEEWHKALKTGCRLEYRRLQSVERLLPLTGVLSIVAVLLIQLKEAAHTLSKTSASQFVPALWLKLLKAKGKIQTETITIHEFWIAVAKLGGFLARKGDGEPGWQTIWIGWFQLHSLAEGARLARKRYG